MPEAPRFSSLIVSRSFDPALPLRRLMLLTVACALHLAVVAGIILGHFLVLETLLLPVVSSAEIPVFIPRRAAAISPHPGLNGFVGGEGSGGTAASTTSGRRRRPAPGAMRQRFAPPGSLVPASQDPTPPGSGRGIGGPDGSGDGPGRGDGCPGCDGTGPGPGGPGGVDGELFDERDPRLVRPLLIASSRVLPRYPALARRAHIEGTVILLIIIGPSGTVGAIEVKRSPDLIWRFDLAAIEAVKRWRYQPALLQGRPVAEQAGVIVEFTLSR